MTNESDNKCWFAKVNDIDGEVQHFRGSSKYPEIKISVDRGKKNFVSWTFDIYTVSFVANCIKEEMNINEIRKVTGIPMDFLEELIVKLEKKLSLS